MSFNIISQMSFNIICSSFFNDSIFNCPLTFGFQDTLIILCLIFLLACLLNVHQKYMLNYLILLVRVTLALFNLYAGAVQYASAPAPNQQNA
jgi:hypothetical protein